MQNCRNCCLRNLKNKFFANLFLKMSASFLRRLKRRRRIYKSSWMQRFIAFCSSLFFKSNFLIAQLIVFTLSIIARMIPAKSINGSKTFTEMPFAIAGNFERKIKLPPTNTSSIASPSIILKSATQILKIKVLSWVVIFSPIKTPRQRRATDGENHSL